MRVLVCSDKFRGTVTAREVGDAVAAGAAGHDVVGQPMADGGEGTLEAFANIYKQGGVKAFWAGTGPKMFESGSKVRHER